MGKQTVRKSLPGFRTNLSLRLCSDAIFSMRWIWIILFKHTSSPWCQERLTEGEEGIRGWDGWMASPMQWLWTWANFGRWWGAPGRPGVLQSMELQRVGHNWATEQKQHLRQTDSQGQPCRCCPHSHGGSHFLTCYCFLICHVQFLYPPITI